MEAYCDGSSLGNGRKTAHGGIGVFFGDDHPWNHSEGFVGSEDVKVTNQTMELRAIAKTLDIAVDHDVGRITIFTDSLYSINCLTRWAANWKRNGWKTASDKPVLNKELILDILKSMEGVRAEFVHVRSHISPPPATDAVAYARWHGNAMADRLATEAARRT